jgi:hypothetical protein
MFLIRRHRFSFETFQGWTFRLPFCLMPAHAFKKLSGFRDRFQKIGTCVASISAKNRQYFFAIEHWISDYFLFSSSNFAFYLRFYDEFCPDFATNSRKEWRVSLFQSILRKQIRNLQKIILEFVKIDWCFFDDVQAPSAHKLSTRDDVQARTSSVRSYVQAPCQTNSKFA